MTSFLEALASWWRRRKLRRANPRYQRLDDLDRLVTDHRNMQAVGEIHQQKQDLLHAQMRKELGWPKPRIHVKAKSRRRMA